MVSTSIVVNFTAEPDRDQKFLLENLLTLVVRNIQREEASVRLGQTLFVPVFDEGHSVLVPQFRAVEGHSGSAPDKLQVGGLVLVGYSGHNVPEHLDDLRIGGTVAILSDSLQLIDINNLLAADPVLDIRPLDDAHNVLRNDNVHALLNPLDLEQTLREPPLAHQRNEFLDVGLVDHALLTTLTEWHLFAID